jgi:hypothetical protein
LNLGMISECYRNVCVGRGGWTEHWLLPWLGEDWGTSSPCLLFSVLRDPVQQFISLCGGGGCRSFVIQRAWFGVLSSVSMPTRMQFLGVGYHVWGPAWLLTSLWGVRLWVSHELEGLRSRALTLSAVYNHSQKADLQATGLKLCCCPILSVGSHSWPGNVGSLTTQALGTQHSIGDGFLSTCHAATLATLSHCFV